MDTLIAHSNHTVAPVSYAMAICIMIIGLIKRQVVRRRNMALVTIKALKLIAYIMAMVMLMLVDASHRVFIQ